MPRNLGVYLHIPYCSALCHYCDFAKTANWDRTHSDRYFEALTQHLSIWTAELLPTHFAGVSTLNIGGGTPSLFAEEYQHLLALLAPWLTSEAEISLEANPGDLTATKLARWKSLGFNRLSLGVQTFHPQGLALLKRDHDANTAMRGIELARNYFANLNVDVIYNWPGQTEPDFLRDLEILLNYRIPHVSLYDLCYPATTPLGRQLLRGKICAPPEENQERLYHLACRELAAAGYCHDEVSNWTLPDFTCAHNWRYWQGDYYLGVGAGAHGFLPEPTHQLGRRYAYGPNDRHFSRLPALPTGVMNLNEDEAAQVGLRFESRNRQSWLYEYVGSATRCRLGLDLERIARVSGFSFAATERVAAALAEEKLKICAGRVTLHEAEWIRETSWCSELLACFS